jgi:hypothetical protein
MMFVREGNFSAICELVPASTEFKYQTDPDESRANPIVFITEYPVVVQVYTVYPHVI